MRGPGVVLLVAVALATQPGCGGRCAKVERAREQAMARPAAAVGPHVRLRAPFALLNRLLAEALVDIEPVPIPLDRLGPLADAVAGISAVPRELRLGPAGPGRVHVELRIELRDLGGTLVTLGAAVDVEPDIERTGEQVAIVIGLRPSEVEALEVVLGADAAAALGRALASRLPAAVRSRVPRFVIDRVAAAIAEEISSGTWALLRRTLVARIGEQTRVRFSLPPVPIASIELSSTTGVPEPALELGVVTALPVRASVAAFGAPPLPDAFELAASGSALAEIGNWAIAAGRAPARYDRSLHPKPRGDYVPHFDWRVGHRRPLLVHVDRVEHGCEWLTVGVTPFAGLREGAVVAGARERAFERVIGSASLVVSAWLKELLQRAVSREVAASMAVTIGPRRLEVTLLDLDLTDVGLRAAATADVHAGAR